MEKKNLKKAVAATTMKKVENEGKKACSSICDLQVQRVLVYNTFHKEYLDLPNHNLSDGDKIHVEPHFVSLATPSTSNAETAEQQRRMLMRETREFTISLAHGHQLTTTFRDVSRK